MLILTLVHQGDGTQATAPERHNIPKELADAYAGFLKHHHGVSDAQFKEIGSIFAEINLAGIPPKITVDGTVVDNPEYLSLKRELASRIALVFNDDIGYVIDPDTQQPKIVNGFKQIATHIWVDPQGNKHLIPRSPANVAHSMVTYYENIIAPKMGTFLSVNNLTSYQLRNAVYDKMTKQFTEFRNKFLSQIVPIYNDLKDQRDAFADLDTEYAKRLSQTIEHIERDLVVKFIRGDYEVNNNFVDGKIDYDVSHDYLLKLIDGDPENGIEGLSEAKARIVNEMIKVREETRVGVDTVSVSP